MAFRGKLLRLIALFVLANIGLAFCNCLHDAIELNSSSGPTLASKDSGGTAPDCGENCGSCICCAPVLVSQHLSFAIALSGSGTPGAYSIEVSEPDLVSITQPPKSELIPFFLNSVPLMEVLHEERKAARYACASCVEMCGCDRPRNFIS
jgi:hypothetical protein